MKCINCGNEMMVTERGTYTYMALPSVKLVGVNISRCPECGEEEVEIPRIEALNGSIAGALASKHAPLAPAEIRFLRKYLGWSGVDTARNFGVAPETVSRWERGSKPMGAVAERLLRVLAVTLKPVAEYPLGQALDIARAEPSTPLNLETRPRGDGWDTDLRPAA
jgi:putative zinc finger/helix-turn-helix YgiT family protein